MARVKYHPSLPEPAVIANFHPYLHQLDLIVPIDPQGDNEDAIKQIGSLSTSYTRITRFPIADLLIQDYFASQHAISLEHTDNEDRWRLDGKGLLTLEVSKDTYERLSLVGTRLGKKSERFVISLHLTRRDSKEFSRAKEAFIRWDAERAESGARGWDVLLAPGAYEGAEAILDRYTKKVYEVKPRVDVSGEVIVPPRLTRGPRPGGDEEEVEIWDEEMEETFEWVGLAAMRSPRLRANDRVDRYVSAYNESHREWPSGRLVHVRWDGFLNADLVERVLQLARDNLKVTRWGMILSGWENIAATVHLSRGKDGTRTGDCTSTSLVFDTADCVSASS